MHRRIFALVFALAAWLSVAAFAQPDAGEKTPQAVTVHPGLLSATTAAERDGAPVLLVFHATWCGPCHQLDAEVFKDEAFSQHAGPLHFVRVDVDQHPAIAQQFGVASIPDLIVLSPDRQTLARMQGYGGKQAMLQWIAEAKVKQPAGVASEPVEIQLPDDGATDRWLELLGASAVGGRQAAMHGLVDQREKAMPVVLAALAASDLTTRVAGGDVLIELAPQAPRFDPWADADARATQLAAVSQWWTKTGRLPDVGETKLDDAQRRSAVDAVNALVAGDPAKVTPAIERLTAAGPDVLPLLRQALAMSERQGDLQAVARLDAVRWTLLVPDELEREIHVRRVLATGSSEQRRAAAATLGGQGDAAMPALRELLDDPDTLVREATVHALTQMPGDDAIAAMALMLHASDSNLRMVAAQQLGETDNPAAAAALAPALNDPDEIVALTAIASLRQLKARSQAGALIAALSDDRWRIRAAAAEAVGELKLPRAADKLRVMLKDSDAYLVRAALEALGAIGKPPSAEEIQQLLLTSPDLTQIAVKQLTKGLDAKRAAELVELFKKLQPEHHVALLHGLEDVDTPWKITDAIWQPLVAEALASPDAAVRLAAVEMMEHKSPSLASLNVAAMLQDTDARVRDAALLLVVRATSHEQGIDAAMEYMDDAGVLTAYEPDAPTPEIDAAELAALQASRLDRLSPLERKMLATLAHERHEQWKALLRTMPASSEPWRLAAARWVLGDAGVSSAELAKLLPDDAAKQHEEALRSLAGMVVYRADWPENSELIERLIDPFKMANVMLAVAVRGENGESIPRNQWTDFEIEAPIDGPPGRRLRGGLVDYLTTPERIEAALAESPEKTAELLLNANGIFGTPAVLALPGTGAALREALLKSTDATARTVAAMSLGLYPDEQDEHNQRIRAMLDDPSLYVRAAAVRALAMRTSNPQDLEEPLAPVLMRPAEVELPGKAKKDLAFAYAAYVLLQPGLRELLEMPTYYLQLPGDQEVWLVQSFEDETPETPVVTYERRPAFLPAVRQRYEQALKADDADMLAVTAMLLGQYGQADIFEPLLERWRQQPSKALTRALLPAALLTGDERYLSVLKQVIDLRHDKYELTRLLRYLHGLRGDEAREMRRNLNRKIENSQD